MKINISIDEEEWYPVARVKEDSRSRLKMDKSEVDEYQNAMRFFEEARERFSKRLHKARKNLEGR